MIPLEEAQAHVFAQITQLDVTSVELSEARSLFTAVPLKASASVPPFDNTAVDGYAVRSADLRRASLENPVVLHILGTLAAGELSDESVEPNTAIRIMTGAPIPMGADSVIMVEDTSRGPNDTVLAFKSTTAGANIRKAGSDIESGDVVFSSYTEITPAVLGSLASMGLKVVPVIRRPRVAVISTGSELTDEVPLPLGKIRDSNRPSLMAAISEMGAEPVDYGPIPDDYDILKEVFARASQECDAVVTSGGVSVGDFDYSKKVLEEISSNQMRWMQISIKPAKPFAFGMIGSKALFGLPGNPVSALVSFELFARPSIAMMMGHPNPFRTVTKASVEAGIKRSPDGKIHFLRSTVKFDQNGKLQCQLNDGQSSHMLNSLAHSNALAVVPDGTGIDKKGLVEVMLLSRVL